MGYGCILPNYKEIRMILRELFDRALPYEWTTQIPGERYVARFMVGQLEYRFSAHLFDYDDNLHGAEIAFCLMDGKKCRTDNTGTGNVNEIYGTVINLIREIAGKLKLSRVVYEAGDVQRQRIYPTLIKKALPSWQISEEWGEYYSYDKPMRKQPFSENKKD